MLSTSVSTSCTTSHEPQEFVNLTGYKRTYSDFKNALKCVTELETNRINNHLATQPLFEDDSSQANLTSTVCSSKTSRATPIIPVQNQSQIHYNSIFSRANEKQKLTNVNSNYSVGKRL